MSLTIFHTADVHIGMSFGRYEPVAGQLIEARFVTLQRLVDQASERGCDLLVVAGDLFNTLTRTAKTIDRVAGILSAFSGCVAVLPGNHDYFAPATDNLWKRFNERAADNVLFLGEARPYGLAPHGLDAVIYPAPCDRKRSGDNAIGWIRDAERAVDVGFHIAVAHGSVDGLSPDAQGDYYPMTRAELEALPVDVVLLGHTHRSFPAGKGAGRVYMPGVPEPDGLDCAHGGTAWLITLEAEGKVRAERCEDLGAHRFLRQEAQLTCAADIDGLQGRLEALDAGQTLLDLVLIGRLNEDAMAALDEAEARWQDRFLWLAVDCERLRPEIDEKTIAAQFAEGTLAHRLLMELASGSDDESAEALQVAHEILQRVREA